MNEKKVKREGLWHRLAEGLVYLSFVILGFYLAFLFRFDFHPPKYNLKPFFDNIPYILLISVVVFYIYDLLSTLKKSLAENALIIFISLIIIDMSSVTLVYFRGTYAFPRTVFVLGFAIQFILIFFTKYIILKMLVRFIKPASSLIVANEEEGSYIEKKISRDRHRSKREVVSDRCLENSPNLFDYVSRVDKIYIGKSVSYEIKEKLIDYGSDLNKTIYLVPSHYEISLVDFKVRQADDLLFLKLNDLGLSAEEKFIKRVVDLVLSSAILILLSPLILLVSISIKLQDGGKVFFVQERLTEDNRVFNIYKFRTMIDNAEEDTGPVLATEDDPRIIPLGRFLRATRLDELPQFINVFFGDMSIVGPRPERPFFVEDFSSEIEGYRYRTKVKAGITGLAQVMSNYKTTAQEKVKYDLLYIRNFSILRDFKIIFDTVKVVFIKEKAQGLEED